MKETDPFAAADFRKCVDFHGHICPGLVMGYRAAKAGLQWLRENRAEDEEVVAVVETDSCGADAVQVLTGCTFGKGNFLFRDYGKMAFTFLSRASGQGVRVARKAAATPPDDRHGELVQKMRNGTASEEEKREFRALHLSRARLLLEMPLEELFALKPAALTLPEKARIEPTRICDGCGEPVMASRLAEQQGRRLCRACALPP